MLWQEEKELRRDTKERAVTEKAVKIVAIYMTLCRKIFGQRLDPTKIHPTSGLGCSLFGRHFSITCFYI